MDLAAALSLLLLFLSSSSGFYVQPEVVSFSASPESQVVPRGFPAELRCAVLKQNTSASLPQPRLSWLLNGSSIPEDMFPPPVLTSTPDHLTSLLTLPSTSPEHAGLFQCLATDGDDATRCSKFVQTCQYCYGYLVTHPCVRSDVLSNGAQLQVIGDVVSSTILQVPPHSSVLLECGSGLASRNGIEIEWSRNGSRVQSGMDLELLSSGDLMLYVEPSAQLQTFDCFVHFSSNNASVHYQSYQVEIMQGTGYTISPQVSTSNPLPTSGQSTELSCSLLTDNSTGNTSLSSVSWIRREREGADTQIQRGSRASLALSGRVLVLQDLEAEDSGVYCCQVEGGSEDCVQLVVLEQVSSNMPTQQFVGNTTRRLDLTCPIYHPNLTTFWFWNGILLDNATERNLTRTSDDQVSLHGVYQCYVGLSDGQEFVAQSDLVTVTRVMPFGLTNPPGGRDPDTNLPTPTIIIDELPWPNVNQVTSTYVEWLVPMYTGNLPHSSLSYRVRTNTPDVNTTTEANSIIVNLPNFATLAVLVGVYHEDYGIISDEAVILFTVDASCHNKVLYPPTSLLSCNRGRPELSSMYDGDANAELFQSNPSSAPQSTINFHRGVCRDLDSVVIYQANSSLAYGSSLTIGDGAPFVAGTYCKFVVANTVAKSEQSLNNPSCYDPLRLLYTNESDATICYVNAYVSFNTAEYEVSESAGAVEVCVRSEGYSFNIILEVTGITATDGDDYIQSGPYLLDFASPNITSVCVNISISEDDILESNETVELQLRTDSPYVIFEANTTTLTIVDNDYVEVRFQQSLINVTESVGSVQACIVISGEYEKNISLTVDAIDSPDSRLFEREEINLVPGSSNLYCFDVSVPSNTALENDRNLTLVLSSGTEGVNISGSQLIIEIQDDDHVTLQFVESNITTSEGDGSVNVCVHVEGELRREVSAMVHANPETANFDRPYGPWGMRFSPSLDNTQCIAVALYDDDLLGGVERFVLTLSSADSRVLTGASASLEIMDNDNITVQYTGASMVDRYQQYSVNESADTLRFCLQVRGVASEVIVLTISTINETAFAGQDFFFQETNTTIQPNSERITIYCYDITILDDITPAGNSPEYFFINVSSGTDGVFLPGRARVLILDDDRSVSGDQALVPATVSVLAVLLVLLIVTVAVVVFVTIISRNNKRSFSSYPVYPILVDGIIPPEADPISDIAFRCRPVRSDDNTSEIVPYFTTTASTIVDTGRRKISEESTSSFKPLLKDHTKWEVERTRRSSCESDLSSGYINMGDTRTGQRVEARSKVAMGEEMCGFEETQFAEHETSSLSSDQSAGCSLAERESSTASSFDRRDLRDLTTNLQSVGDTLGEQDDREMSGALAAPHASSHDQSAKQNFYEKDSGFSYGDTGYTSSADNCEISLGASATNFSSHLNKDSGCPVQDYRHPLTDSGT